MYAKAQKGTVVVGSDKGSLRLQIPSTVTSTGKQAYVPLGLKDLPENRRIAEGYALQVQAEILQGKFDITLERYRAFKTNHRQLSVVKPITTASTAYTVGKLWDDWCEYKRDKVAETTFLRKYLRTYKNGLEPFESLLLSSDTGLTISSKLQLNQVDKKCLLSQLEAATDWAIDLEKYNKKNPFRNLGKQVVVKTNKDLYSAMPDEEEVKAFSKEERDIIIDAFKNSRWANRRSLANFVYFLFHTGCRPGEASELRWGDIKADCSRVIFRRSYDGSLRITKETKTGEIRAFNCNEQLQEFLKSMRPASCQNSDLVFLGNKGKRIDANVLYKAWATKTVHGKDCLGVVDELVLNGLIAQSLSPYHCRHTFINLAIEAGVPPEVVAAQVGHSVAVARSHYYDNRQASLYVIPKL